MRFEIQYNMDKSVLYFSRCNEGRFTRMITHLGRFLSKWGRYLQHLTGKWTEGGNLRWTPGICVHMLILRFMVLCYSFVGIGRLVVSGTAGFLMRYAIIKYTNTKLTQPMRNLAVGAMESLPR